MITCVYECYAINCRCVSFYYLAWTKDACLGRDLLSFSTLLSMIFIAPQGINCGSHSPQRFYNERLYKRSRSTHIQHNTGKGRAQGRGTSAVQATFKQAALYTQLSKLLLWLPMNNNKKGGRLV